HATADRQQTLQNLREALLGAGGTPAAEPASFDLTADQLGSFLGIGFGYLVVEALFEAMEHEHTLGAPELWQEAQDAINALRDPAPEAWRRRLQVVADRLLAAREVLYPTTIHLLDLCLLDEGRLAEPLPGSFAQGLPLNLLASASLLEKWGQQQP